jgi:hypothetical protein
MTQTNVIGKRVQAARDLVGIRRVLVAARSDRANTSIDGRRPAVDVLLVLAVNQGLVVIEPVQVGPIRSEISLTLVLGIEAGAVRERVDDACGSRLSPLEALAVVGEVLTDEHFGAPVTLAPRKVRATKDLSHLDPVSEQ